MGSANFAVKIAASEPTDSELNSTPTVWFVAADSEESPAQITARWLASRLPKGAYLKRKTRRVSALCAVGSFGATRKAGTRNCVVQENVGSSGGKGNRVTIKGLLRGSESFPSCMWVNAYAESFLFRVGLASHALLPVLIDPIA